MTRSILGNATLVLPDRVLPGGCLVMEGGVIAAIGEGCPPGAEDCGGDLVLPGLVELHTDNLERHISPRPRVDWPHGPAILAHDAELAGCGITTVFDALRVGSIPQKEKGNYGQYARTLASELQALRAAGALKISHLIHLRAEMCSETLEAELAAFAAEDGIGIVSLMDHTPGARQFRDTAQLRAWVMGRHGMNEAEFQAHIASQKALGAANAPRHRRAAVAAARRIGAVIASHDDTTGADVAESAGDGASFAEFPTTLEAAAACRSAGIAVMMGAPNLIRGGSHSGNVSAGSLAEAGLLDILSSDYVPAALLSAALLLADLWDDLPRGIATATAAPAAAAGLTDRGRLAPGLRADVIRLRRLSAGAAALRGTWAGGERVA